MDFKNKNKDKNINIGVTSIHHTSFKNIIEENFSQENIHIFDIDENYNIIIIPENKKNIKYDLIIVTHLWGMLLVACPPFNNKKINNIRNNMAKIGNFNKSNVSNYFIND